MKGFSIKQAYREAKEALKSPIEREFEEIYKRLPFVVKLALYFESPTYQQKRVFLNLNIRVFPQNLQFIVSTIERFKAKGNVIKRVYFIDNQNVSTDIKSLVYHRLKQINESLNPRQQSF